MSISIEDELKKLDSALELDLAALNSGKICCAESSPTKEQNVIYPGADEIISNQSKKLKIFFNGHILRGGVKYDKNSYIDEKADISYIINGKDLEVKNLCDESRFSIAGFNSGDFGINLAGSGKEIALVVSSCDKMSGYIEALKEISYFLAEHIFDNNAFAKISLINYYGDEAKDCGTFYAEDVESFAEVIEKFAATKHNERLISYALINAMKNFTRYNNLQKEVYLIGDGNIDQRVTDKLLSLLKTLNRNTSRGENEEINKVKIHSFSLGGDFKFLKDIANFTNGSYHRIYEPYGFQKELLTLSNNGVFNRDELNNEIFSIKTNKISDGKEKYL